MKKRDKVVLIVSIIGLFLVIAGITYAYFSARITGVESTSTIVLTGGRMEIVYDNLSGNMTANNIYPREEAWVTKNFTVTGTNSTNTTMNYRVGLEIIASDFETGDLKYSLTNTREDSGTAIDDITNANIKASGTTWFGYGQFVNGTDQVHAYTLTIYFPDTGLDQNDLQGANFAAKVVIVDAGMGTLPSDVYYGWNGSTSSLTSSDADPDNYGVMLKGLEMATFSQNMDPGASYTFDTSGEIPYVCGNIGTGQVCVNYETTDLEAQCRAVGGSYESISNSCIDLVSSVLCEVITSYDAYCNGAADTQCEIDSDGNAICNVEVGNM